MSNDLEFRWEWPADRQAEVKLVLQVDKIEDYEQGLFGIKGSPSIANSLPDPVKVSGKVVGGESSFMSQMVHLILPKLELGEVVNQNYLLVGLTADKILICVKKVDSADAGLSDPDC